MGILNFFRKNKKKNLKLFFLYEPLADGKSCLLRAVHMVDVEEEKTIGRFKIPRELEDQIHDIKVVVRWEKIIDSVWKDEMNVPKHIKSTPIFLEYCNFLKNIAKKFGENIDQIICEIIQVETNR